MNELKEKSIASCKLWKEAGKPRSGSVFGTGVTNLHIEMVFVVNNDWKQKYIQTIFTMRCCRNRVRPFGTAGSPNLNMVGLIVVPFQLVVFLMLVL